MSSGYLKHTAIYENFIEDELSFTISSGKSILIRGMAGAGKSSILEEEFIKKLNRNFQTFTFEFDPSSEMNNFDYLPKFLSFLAKDIQKPNYSFLIQKEILPLLEKKSKTKPVLLCFEDIHLAPKEFFEFIKIICIAISKIPVVVICTSRPTRALREINFGKIRY